MFEPNPSPTNSSNICTKYDAMAENFIAGADFSPINALYERPAMPSILPPLREFHRVLKPQGCPVFFTQYPCMVRSSFNLPDYFEKVLIEDQWSTGLVRYYHTSSRSISANLEESGFTIERLLEPQPVEPMLSSHLSCTKG